MRNLEKNSIYEQYFNKELKKILEIPSVKEDVLKSLEEAGFYEVIELVTADKAAAEKEDE